MWFKYVSMLKIEKQIIKHYFTTISFVYQTYMVLSSGLSSHDHNWGTTHSAIISRDCNSMWEWPGRQQEEPQQGSSRRKAGRLALPSFLGCKSDREEIDFQICKNLFM